MAVLPGLFEGQIRSAVVACIRVSDDRLSLFPGFWVWFESDCRFLWDLLLIEAGSAFAGGAVFSFWHVIDLRKEPQFRVCVALNGLWRSTKRDSRTPGTEALIVKDRQTTRPDDLRSPFVCQEGIFESPSRSVWDDH